MKVYDYEIETVRSHLPDFCEWFRSSKNISIGDVITPEDVLSFTRDQLVRFKASGLTEVECVEDEDYSTIARLIAYKEFINCDFDHAEIDDFLPCEVNENISDFYYWFLQYVEFEKIDQISNRNI